ncbi:ATP-dependent Clp protease adaptor ClpS [Helicobacter anatolicus]|uniref:ATP-dependent Clp protease adaptor ClpS n=1 Tax=Helicobacter anatolicus TaxID=2905874 RepID=UPI001E59F289|nr:ATP-dependent Clp protease adaptor ClpS [Helicobacter anatolicus]MCE3037576.1 ATP-dependent Clp protease adaptor ClpS [Helicobacter anatolicus]MCE3038547.1 ATP-dependent Clp protease adaptor ClpS [Helicobacter anatolicus]MCE3039969.1 ATP-dependent Clp protease adaptor ClpS [Helicobacter anatolicus]
MSQSSFEEKVSVLLQEPIMASVLMFDNDYTPMDFVVELLVEIFEKNYNKATEIMLSVHNDGSGVCGTYPYDIAELKINLAKNKAEACGYPLRFELKML